MARNTHPRCLVRPALAGGLLVAVSHSVAPIALAQEDWREVTAPGSGETTPPARVERPAESAPPPTRERPRGATPAPLPTDGGDHRITQVVIEYVRANAAHPTQDEVLGATVPLLETPEGFVSPREDDGATAPTRVTLAEIPTLGNQMFFDSALARIAPAVVIRLQQLGLIGVYAEPDRAQFAVVGGRVQDRREPGDTSLRLLITTGHVTEVNSTGLGERLPEDETVNNAVHARIRESSPVQPIDALPDTPGAEGTGGLLRGDEIDRYVHFLNRHPGRRVDVAVAATGEEPGAVALDYLVTENRPWLLYAQVANTGTDSTDALRERFGFIHNQLTNSDDILSVEYLTSNFSDLHAVVASYERPIFSPRLRGRVFGSWYTYTASDVGQPDADFDGDGWSVGAELVWNFHQINDRFFDAVAGVRYESVQVDNKLADIEGDDRIVVGYVGGRYERIGVAASTRASVSLEFSLDGLNGDSVNTLGRFDADRNWASLSVGLEQSFYLEPLLDPNLSESASLVHEFVFSARGQLAFNNRLIPTYEQVAGGLFTVRGYHEAVVAGDSAFIGSAEYRFHLPRSFSPEPKPADFLGAPFRFSPQYKYGPVDWDLIFKAFVDVGITENSHRKSFEEDNTLVGTGIGAELQLSRRLNARMDLGWALTDAKTFDDNIDDHAGDFRIHFLVTLIF